MTCPGDFSELQAGFYNAFLTGMGLSAGAPVQLLQPSNALSSGPNADALLWQYFNFLPPDSLTGSFILSGGNQFLTNYQGLLSVLEAQPNDFESTVGSACFNAWNEALKSGAVILGSDVGTTFLVFAMGDSNCSCVAAEGAAAITRAFLDPIFAAQQNVLPYMPAGTRDVNFVPGFSDLQTLLSRSPPRSFSVTQDAWDSDVSKTWSKEISPPFAGLCGDTKVSSSVNQKFTTGGVAVEASFAHIGQFTAQPGNWYGSKAFKSAFDAQTGSPWIAGKPIDWGTTFGPDGNMQRYTSTLIVADSMDVTVTSRAGFDKAEQDEITTRSRSGMWPFPIEDNAKGANTGVSFADDTMTIRITSQAGVPIVVAIWVLTASQYLNPTP